MRPRQDHELAKGMNKWKHGLLQGAQRREGVVGRRLQTYNLGIVRMAVKTLVSINTAMIATQESTFATFALK